MTDGPIRDPEPPDPRLDRDAEAEGSLGDRAGTTRPSAAEGGDEPDGGERPPTPSQAEGERDPSLD